MRFYKFHVHHLVALKEEYEIPESMLTAIHDGTFGEYFNHLVRNTFQASCSVWDFLFRQRQYEAVSHALVMSKPPERFRTIY